MPPINFKAKLFKINSWAILALPKRVSVKLPSRGMVMVEGTINLWKTITPMARWDWIRWIGATKNSATRSHRIDVALSKLQAGDRRPCCFNRSACTIPDVSHNGILIGPTQ